MSTTSDLAVSEGLPVSFDFIELIRSDIEPLVLIVAADLFDKGLREGRLSTQDLAGAGILQRVVEGPEEAGVDIRELPGNDWGTTAEDRMKSPKAQRLLRLIREAGRTNLTEPIPMRETPKAPGTSADD